MFYFPLIDRVSQDSLSPWAIPLSEPINPGPNHSFIPGTNIQYIYDSVSLSLLKECPRKYDFKMNQGWDWQTKPATLAYGINFHSCMECYHKLRAYGFDFDTSLRRTIRLAALFGDRLLSHRTERTKETLMRCVAWYLDQYKNDLAVTALFPDGTPAVELSFTIPLFKIRLEPTDTLPPLDIKEVDVSDLKGAVNQGRKLFGKLVGDLGGERKELEESFYSITIYLAGHIDRVVHLQGEVLVSDYKTTKGTLDEKFLNSFNPSGQFMTYLIAAHVLASTPNSVFPEPPAGLMLDGVQLGVTYNRFQRFFIRKTKEDVNKFLNDLEATIKVKALGYAHHSHYPAEEGSCHNYGGCEFLPVCSRSPSEWPRLLKANFRKNVWDPSCPR